MKLHRLLRNRAIGLTRRALAPAAEWRARREPPTVTLAAVGRRLELLLAAMYGRRMSVGVDPPISTSSSSTVAQPDVVLPAVLDARDGEARAVARYRVLAIEQGARLVRGTIAELPPSDPLERDLYALAEGATIDRAIVRQAPGLADELRTLRRTELARRFALDRSPRAERVVEALLQSVLASDPADDTAAIAEMATPADSAAWAREEARRIRAGSPVAMHYRGIPAMQLWALSAPAAGVQFGSPLVTLLRRPAASDQPMNDATRQGVGDRQSDKPATEGEEALTAAAEAGAGEQSSAQPRVEATAREAPLAPGGILYREWDEYAGRYRPDEVTVQARVASETDDGWATEVLRTYAPLVRQIRGRFAPLRAHRTRLRAQRAGDELDLDACVAALVDLQRGHPPDDRLYRLTRPARRTLAIMLLVDVSGSTNAVMADGRTVLEVERMTLLLASEALDELGDPYAVLAFSSNGRHDVQVDAVKAFVDHDAGAVRRRISALASARNTRLGAAVRHATALLNAQAAERRLLLLLSDGQPNDIFGYQGSYAVGDSRRAVLEARASGVHPFCLTVDREEQEYLPHLFGTNGYRILRDPGQLPAVLLQVVTHLLPG
ncbi:MAG: VWA domain-containing protein [Gemmatimonadaceae bacterium]|nr:VWA domain-containing protein [Gemmatimonadaceae bacterium]